jgi:hypothetical protein
MYLAALRILISLLATTFMACIKSSVFQLALVVFRTYVRGI